MSYIVKCEVVDEEPRPLRASISLEASIARRPGDVEGEIMPLLSGATHAAKESMKEVRGLAYMLLLVAVAGLWFATWTRRKKQVRQLD